MDRCIYEGERNLLDFKWSAFFSPQNGGGLRDKAAPTCAYSALCTVVACAKTVILSNLPELSRERKKKASPTQHMSAVPTYARLDTP